MQLPQNNAYQTNQPTERLLAQLQNCTKRKLRYTLVVKGNAMINNDQEANQFIAQQQAKFDKVLLARLNRVHKTGEFSSRRAGEWLLVRGMIISPSNAANSYKYYELTPLGLETLERLRK
jgi:hypothetical protein